MTRAIIGLTFKVMYHAYHGDHSYSVNGQFIKNSIDCKEQNQHSFIKPQCKS